MRYQGRRSDFPYPTGRTVLPPWGGGINTRGVHVLTSIDQYYGRESIDSIDAAPMSKQHDCNSSPKFASNTRTVRKESGAPRGGRLSIDQY